MQGEAIDAWVTEIYGRAGADLTHPPGPVALARALLGPDSVVMVQRPLHTMASLARVWGEWRIYVRRGLPAEQLGFSIAHELAEWAIGNDGGTEADCNALGAALIAPRPAFLRALDTRGGVPGVAAALRTTESLAWLRFGEVTGTPLCLVAPTTVRVRGRDYSWPSDETALRGLAKTRRRGLKKTRLRDDRRRTALVAEQLSFGF